MAPHSDWEAPIPLRSFLDNIVLFWNAALLDSLKVTQGVLLTEALCRGPIRLTRALSCVPIYYSTLQLQTDI